MVIMMSLWRNDASRDIENRMNHLLSKRSVDAWLWGVGDSTDETFEILSSKAQQVPRITVLQCDSGIEGAEPVNCRRRTAWTASRMFAQLPPGEIACLHESDLLSPEDVVCNLAQNPLPVAAWPLITLNGKPQFYDIWAFRDLKGKHFKPDAPRHSKPFCVSSFGSCWLTYTNLLIGRELTEEAVVSLCKQWRAEGHNLWVDPRVVVHQPTHLWEAM